MEEDTTIVDGELRSQLDSALSSELSPDVYCKPGRHIITYRRSTRSGQEFLLVARRLRGGLPPSTRVGSCHPRRWAVPGRA